MAFHLKTEIKCYPSKTDRVLYVKNLNQILNEDYPLITTIVPDKSGRFYVFIATKDSWGVTVKKQLKQFMSILKNMIRRNANDASE